VIVPPWYCAFRMRIWYRLWDRTVSALLNYSCKVSGFLIKIGADGPLKVKVVTSF